MWSALRARWQNLLYGLWFIPGLLVAGMAAAAFGLVWFDRTAEPSNVSWLFGGGPSAARDVLSSIASAVATIAGVVFSITVVTLQLVSSQFTPRALRRFLKDRVTQVAAGVFVGTFVYCLLVLRTVRDEGNGGGEFVPATAITVGIALGVLSLVLLLVFVHHIASIVQASTIAADLGHQTLEVLDRLFPDAIAAEEPDGPHRATLLADWRAEGPPVVACPTRAGYVQVVGVDELLGNEALAEARLHVVVRPGDFVTPEMPLVEAWRWRKDEQELRRLVERAIVVEDERDLRDDVGFGLRQLTDIAVRALSPSLNDPTTAVTCIGHIRSVTERLVGRRLVDGVIPRDGASVIVEKRSFAEYIRESYGELAAHSRGDLRVIAALLEAIDATRTAGARSGAHGRLAALDEVREAAASDSGATPA